VVKVYNEEQTGRVEAVADKANDNKTIFKGIRFYFGRKVKHTENGFVDDDTSAVTFYFNDDDNSLLKDKLKEAFTKALKLLDNPTAFDEAIAKVKAMYVDFLETKN
jgi:hypothetical protein